jgi:cAMP phosphodiesterase
MRCLEVNQHYFVSFSKESTTIQKAVFDVQLWNELEAEISDVYHQEACRPSKKRKCSNELASKLTSYVDTNVELMAELSSIEGST